MSQPARVLSDGDVRRTLRFASRGPSPRRDEVIVLLSLRAGLRACEIAGLSWPMVLRPDGRLADQIQVAGSIAKNGRGRLIPMHSELRRALQLLHRSAGNPVVGPVIKSQRGSHMRPRSIVTGLRNSTQSLAWKDAHPTRVAVPSLPAPRGCYQKAAAPFATSRSSLATARYQPLNATSKATATPNVA